MSRETEDLHRQMMYLETKYEWRREKFHMKSMSEEDYLAMKEMVEDEYEQQQLAKRRKWEAERDKVDRECRAMQKNIEAPNKRIAARLADMSEPERDALDAEEEVEKRRKALKEFREELKEHLKEVSEDASATEKWTLAYCTAAGYMPSLKKHLSLWRHARFAANRLEPPEPHNDMRHYSPESARKLWLDKVWSTDHGNTSSCGPSQLVPPTHTDLPGLAKITFDEQRGFGLHRANAEWSRNTSDCFMSVTMCKDLGLYVDTTIKAPWDTLGDARYNTGPLGLRGTVITIEGQTMVRFAIGNGPMRSVLCWLFTTNTPFAVVDMIIPYLAAPPKPAPSKEQEEIYVGSSDEDEDSGSENEENENEGTPSTATNNDSAPSAPAPGTSPPSGNKEGGESLPGAVASTPAPATPPTGMKGGEVPPGSGPHLPQSGGDKEGKGGGSAEDPPTNPTASPSTTASSRTNPPAPRTLVSRVKDLFTSGW